MGERGLVTWIQDLSPCTYFGDEAATVLKAVGWLSSSHQFATGEVSVEFFAKLVRLANKPAPQPFVCGGSQPCDLCQFTGASTAQRHNGLPVKGVGHLNLFVPSDRFLFAAPESITHYVDAHRYLPPDEFISAVLACAEPDTIEFKKQYLEAGGRKLMELAGRG